MKRLSIACLLALGAGRMLAQTTVTTSGGASGVVPAFNGSATIGNSPIAVSGNNVGIGTSAPLEPFTVMATNSLTPIYGGFNTTTANSVVTFGKIPLLELVGNGNANQGPNIGLLQLNIGSPFTNQSAAELYLAATRATTAAAAGTQPVGNTDILGKIGFYGDDGTNLRTRGAVIDSEVDTAQGTVSAANMPAVLNLATTGLAPIVFYTNLGDSNVGPYFGSPTEKMRIDYNGNVGIGTTTPGAKLEVNGSVKLSSGSGASITFPDGTLQTTAWTGALCGGDYAESVDVAGGRAQYEPGDAMVVDPANPGGFLKSAEAYSTLVAGIYSTKPGVVGKRFTDPERLKEEIPMAMVGIVPAKVSAENGPVKPGDLLVTSLTAGYVMKGTDRERMMGAVVGKALGSVASGTGVIEVLVTLQ